MDAVSFYRPVDPQLCQGDILERVPHVLLKAQPRPLRKTTLSGNRIVYEMEELAEGALPTTPEEGVLVPATCHVSRAMLLTHDCEIDKDKKHRTVVLIRPLPANMPAQDRATIQQNRRFPFFYLPEAGDQLPESYVDFRRMCTVSPQWVDSAKRLASLTAVAQQALLLQLFRFLARVELDRACLPSRSDSAAFLKPSHGPHWTGDTQLMGVRPVLVLGCSLLRLVTRKPPSASGSTRACCRETDRWSLGAITTRWRPATGWCAYRGSSAAL